MKIGGEILISLRDMLEPKVGHIFYIKLPEEDEPVTTRLMSVSDDGALLKIVSKDTKE